MSLYTELDHRTYRTLLLLFFFFLLSSLLNWKVLRAGDIVGVQCMFTTLNCDLQDSGLGPDAQTTQEQEVMAPLLARRQTSSPPPLTHEPFPHSPQGSYAYSTTCLYHSFYTWQLYGNTWAVCYKLKFQGPP